MTSTVGSPVLRRTLAGLAVLLLAVATASCNASPSATLRPNLATIPGTPSVSVAAASPAGTPSPSAAGESATYIQWTRLTGAAQVWGGQSTSGDNWTVFGWSHGYIAFDEPVHGDPPKRDPTITASSTDGVHWVYGGSFTPIGVTDGYRGIANVVEGPGGLLAVGTTWLGACGSEAYEAPAAISADGVTWKALNPQIGRVPANDDSVQAIAGGQSGYVATGSGGVFTSADGMIWRQADLKQSAFKAFGRAESGASFAGGFVISGESNVPEYGVNCAAPTYRAPSLWWSSDGITWTQETVPGGPSSSGDPMEVCRYGDTLVAGERTDDGKNLEWFSKDGKAWVPLTTSDLVLCPHQASYALRVSGQTNLVLSEDALDRPTVFSVGADLTVTQLSQTGDIPDWVVGDPVILGPAGLIEVDHAGNTYVGVPVTR